MSNTSVATPTILGSFTLHQSDLRTAITRLKPAMLPRPTLPILAAVLIIRHNDETTIVADNLSVRATHRIPSRLPTPKSDLARSLSKSRHARENCSLAVPFKTLVEAVSASDRNEVIRFTGTRDDEKFLVEIAYQVRGITARKLMEAFDPAEFPFEHDNLTYSKPFAFDANARASFFKAYEATSTDVTRHVLNGVALDSSTDHHAIVATDCKQLITANSIRLPFCGIVIVPTAPIFETKLLRETSWTLVIATPKRKHPLERATAIAARLQTKIDAAHKSEPEGANDVSYYTSLCARLARVQNYHSFQQARLRIVCGSTTYDLKAIEGNYPHYRQIIPSAKDYKLSVPFDSAVRDRILAIVPKLPAESENKTEYVDLYIDKEHVSVVAGQTSLPLPTVPKWKGEPGEIRLRMQRVFLLRAARFGFSEMNITEASSPYVFTNSSSTYITVPMRLDA